MGINPIGKEAWSVYSILTKKLSDTPYGVSVRLLLGRQTTTEANAGMGKTNVDMTVTKTIIETIGRETTTVDNTVTNCTVIVVVVW